MKKLVMGLTLMATSAMAATPQQFYRAGDGMNLIEGGWQMNTITSEADADGAEENKNGSSDFSISYQRGLTADVAVGVRTGMLDDNSGSGMKDIDLFVEGQFDMFFYGANVAISGDIETDEDGDQTNQKSGGMNYTLTLGYGFMENAGVRLDYTPAFTATTKPDSGDSTETDNDVVYWLQAYYEYSWNDCVFGGALGTRSDAGDADNDDDTTTFTTVEAYYVHQFNESFDLTANLRYWMGDREDLSTLNVQGLDVGARFRF